MSKSTRSTKRKRPAARRKQSLEEQYLASMPLRFAVEPDQDPYPEELASLPDAPEPAEATNPMPTARPASLPKSNKPQPLSLEDIRVEVLRAQTRNAHTIADLEAWRAEIDATIAFLKSRDR